METSSTSGVNKSVIIGIGCGIVAAALVGGVIFMSSRSSASRMPTPTVQENQNTQGNTYEVARGPSIPANATVIIITGEAPNEPTIAAIKRDFVNQTGNGVATEEATPKSTKKK